MRRMLLVLLLVGCVERRPIENADRLDHSMVLITLKSGEEVELQVSYADDVVVRGYPRHAVEERAILRKEIVSIEVQEIIPERIIVMCAGLALLLVIDFAATFRFPKD